jgi:ABC-type nitrate/sulfonate/bicarbonate transport system permease component
MMRHFAIFDFAINGFKSAWVAALLIGLWWWASAGSTSFYFPPLGEILSVLLRDLLFGPLGPHLVASLSNLAIGLSIAIISAVATGLVVGRSEPLRRAISPTLNFLRAVPPASIVPIIIIALGVGPAPKICIIAIGCFWPILLNTIDGVRGTAPSLVETARAYRIPPLLSLFRVALPAALPQIMAGIRIALAVGLVLMVISEFFGADTGVGFYITDASTRFAIRETWAGTLLVGMMGYVLSFGFLLIERRLLRWYFQDDRTSILARFRPSRPKSGGGE